MEVGASEGGAGGIRPPPPIQKYGRAKYVSPPIQCALINVIYIKTSILLFLIQIVAKEFYQTYGGGGLIIVCTPPPHP